jgi:hypothetical protein
MNKNTERSKRKRLHVVFLWYPQKKTFLGKALTTARNKKVIYDVHHKFLLHSLGDFQHVVFPRKITYLLTKMGVYVLVERRRTALSWRRPCRRSAEGRPPACSPAPTPPASRCPGTPGSDSANQSRQLKYIKSKDVILMIVYREWPWTRYITRGLNHITKTCRRHPRRKKTEINRCIW